MKRNCIRVIEREEEARNINCEPINKNRIEGVAEQSERAIDRRSDPNSPSGPVRTRMSGGVAGAQSIMAVPYADYNVTYCHVASSNLDAIPRQNS